jgi:hypothetical protein
MIIFSESSSASPLATASIPPSLFKILNSKVEFSFVFVTIEKI